MLLNRRAMMTALPAMVPAVAAMQAEGGRRTNIYVLEQFFLENGSQPERIHNFFSKALIPTMRRFHNGPAIFAEAPTAPHMPQVLAIFSISSVEEIFDLSNKLFAEKTSARPTRNGKPESSRYSPQARRCCRQRITPPRSPCRTRLRRRGAFWSCEPTIPPRGGN